MIISLIICSITLLVAWGTKFCFPAKYPFKTLDMDIKGRVKAIALSIISALGSLSKSVAIKLADKNIVDINIKFIVNIIVAAVVKIRILRPLFSATNLEIDIGIAKGAIVSNNEYVGVAIVYKLIPYGPIILV